MLHCVYISSRCKPSLATAFYLRTYATKKKVTKTKKQNDSPPTAQPPTTTAQPPTAQPPTAQPPTAQPPTAQPPTAQPPTAQPPAQPPTAQPPTAQPPTAQPPTAQPPTAQPEESHKILKKKDITFYGGEETKNFEQLISSTCANTISNNRKIDSSANRKFVATPNNEIAKILTALNIAHCESRKVVKFEPRLLQILSNTIPNFIPPPEINTFQQSPASNHRNPVAPALSTVNMFKALAERAAKLPLQPFEGFTNNPVNPNSEGLLYRFQVKKFPITKNSDVYEHFARIEEHFTKPDWPLLDYLGLPEKIIVDRTAPIPQLQHGLSKVLFSPGVHPLRDLTTAKFNFSPNLFRIHQPTEIDFHKIPAFITSSKDETLHALAEEYGSLYKGSTSSISPLLAQFYYLLSEHKAPNLSSLSGYMQYNSQTFTKMSRKAVAVVLRPHGNVIAIDSDPGNVVADNQILLDLGKSLERMVTQTPRQFEEMTLKQDHGELTPTDNKESYLYVQKGPFMFRSQQDCFHPGINSDRKVFDLKSRACVAVRSDCANYEQGSNYKITTLLGDSHSYEREYYDMVRSGFAKYYFQSRIGHMAGIFVMYHSTKETFGFEYIPREELEQHIFGNSIWANKVYEITLQLLNIVLGGIKPTISGPARLLFKADQQNDRMEIFVEELEVDEGWREASDAALATSQKLNEMANMPKTQKRAAQVELITNKVRWYTLKLAKFVNGLRIEPFDYSPGDNLEIFYNFYENSYEYNTVLESYAEVLRNTKNFKEFD